MRDVYVWNMHDTWRASMTRRLAGTGEAQLIEPYTFELWDLVGGTFLFSVGRLKDVHQFVRSIPIITRIRVKMYDDKPPLV